MFHASTPRKISPAIKKFCREVAPGSEPLFISVTPIPGAAVDDCFPTIERQVQKHGGSICYGWSIWEWSEIMVEAEFHAVWSDQSGQLHDLTAKSEVVDRILFLADPTRTYEGKQVNNIRRSLSSRPVVQEFIDAANARFEFMNRGEREFQHGEVRVRMEEKAEYLQIQKRFAEAQQQIISHLPPPGRNERCPCGSGRKFKKCHGG